MVKKIRGRLRGDRSRGAGSARDEKLAGWKLKRGGRGWGIRKKKSTEKVGVWVRFGIWWGVNFGKGSKKLNTRKERRGGGGSGSWQTALNRIQWGKRKRGSDNDSSRGAGIEEGKEKPNVHSR